MFVCACSETADCIQIQGTCCSSFQSMSHEADDLAVPAVRWLGVHPTDISRLGIKTQPLTVADGNKLRKLMTRQYIIRHKALQDQVQSGLKLTIDA